MLLRSLFCHELKRLYLVRRKHYSSIGRIIATIFFKYDNSRIIVAIFLRGDDLVEQGLRFKLVRINLNLKSSDLCGHVEATIAIGLQHYVGM
jgi:hypothetical protein